MADERTTSPDYSEALLAAALERLRARGDAARRYACMQLPAPVFHDLCARLMDRTHTVKDTALWLAGQTAEAPTRSSVERFSDALFEEYRLAQLAERRRAAENYVAQATAGDPDAQQMALNTRLTELLTDELMRAGAGGEIETKRFMALMMGARTVAMTAFDKQKMDARMKALEVEIAHREATIEALRQRIEEGRRKLERALADVQAKAAGGKRALTDEDIAEVRKAVFG